MTELPFLQSRWDGTPDVLDFTKLEEVQSSALGQIASASSQNQFISPNPTYLPGRSATDQKICPDPITGQTLGAITFTRFDGTNGHIFSIKSGRQS